MDSGLVVVVSIILSMIVCVFVVLTYVQYEWCHVLFKNFTVNIQGIERTKFINKFLITFNIFNILIFDPVSFGKRFASTPFSSADKLWSMGFLVNARDATLFVIHCSSGFNENVGGNVNSHLCNFHSIFKSYSSEIILRFLVAQQLYRPIRFFFFFLSFFLCPVNIQTHKLNNILICSFVCGITKHKLN